MDAFRNTNDTVSTSRHKKSNSSAQMKLHHGGRNALSEVAYTSSLKYGQTVNSMSLCIQLNESRLVCFDFVFFYFYFYFYSFLFFIPHRLLCEK